MFSLLRKGFSIALIASLMLVMVPGTLVSSVLADESGSDPSIETSTGNEDASSASADKASNSEPTSQEVSGEPEQAPESVSNEDSNDNESAQVESVGDKGNGKSENTEQSDRDNKDDNNKSNGKHGNKGDKDHDEGSNEGCEKGKKHEKNPLVIWKKANPASGSKVSRGDIITYTLYFKNNGCQTLKKVKVVDMVPAGTTFQSATDGGTLEGDKVVWKIGKIEAKSGGSVSFQVKVNDDVPGGTLIKNAAMIFSKCFKARSNTTKHCVEVEPDLNITKSADPVSGTTVARGDTITYFLDFSETTGLDPATDVVITDIVPTGTTFVSATGGGVLSDSTVTWNIGPVAAGGSGQVSFTVTVDNDVPGGTIITNFGTIDSNETDPKDSNITEHPVELGPGLTISKSSAPVSGSTVSAGDTVTYIVNFSETTGIDDATGVVVTDIVPDGTTLVPGSISDGGTEAGGTITWNIGTVLAGQTRSVSFAVTVNDDIEGGTTISNFGTIVSNETDSQDSNTVVLSVPIPVTPVTPAGQPTQIITPAEEPSAGVAVAGEEAVAAAGAFPATGLPWVLNLWLLIMTCLGVISMGLIRRNI